MAGMASDGVEVLHESARTLVTRLRAPHGSVIRKQCHGADCAGRIRSERELLQRLSAVPGVPRLADGTAPEAGALTMVDSGHVSLEEFAAAGPPETSWLIGFARDVARVLAGVHAAGVLHGDLSPGNILVRPDGTDPLLADYDLASAFVEDHPEFTHPSEIAGTLPYLSPERTGRTGRAVDQRSDLYSLGAVLYELATGRPPFGFGSQDPLGLVHAHLALAPVPPTDLVPDLPPMLSAILMRLLEKEPDRRYSGAEGLAHDLARLAASPAGRTTVFPLGDKDFPLRLAPPSRLVGRDAEFAVLRETFDAARVGAPPGACWSGGRRAWGSRRCWTSCDRW
jgi:serine/threonine protein kinase